MRRGSIRPPKRSRSKNVVCIGASGNIRAELERHGLRTAVLDEVVVDERDRRQAIPMVGRHELRILHAARLDTMAA